MKPDRFERLQSLVLAALKLPATDRDSFLAHACDDDPELLQEARSLLDFDREQPVPDLARTAGAAPLLDAHFRTGTAGEPPRSIGNYAVIGVLGRGGMGEVFHARMEKPIRRDVAIKVLRRGAYGESFPARFEAERQLLADMDHPGIAHVFEAGEDEDGRPYFVMELVHGAPVTDYCLDRSLDLTARLRLVIRICDAVQHAHQKGIIHRDLKPSNLLVTEANGEPRPKVIDFGVAKAVHVDAGARDTETMDGQLVGTLAYMSPEQALGESSGIDTRADVYSLGVILYELITGRLPHETDGLPLPEAAHRIAERDPPTLKSAMPDTRIDLDLELIVAKALAKDPDHRYASASALGDDLERYFAGHPVLARPPSSMDQLRKLIRRNRLPFALSVSIVGLVLLFGIGMSFLFQQQRTERARAETEAEKARSTNRFLRDMLGSVEGRGRQVTVREVLGQAARDAAANFPDQPEIEAALRSTIGGAFTSLGDFEAAAPHLEAALVLRQSIPETNDRDISESLAGLAEFHLRRSLDRTSVALADSFATESLRLRERGGADDRSLASALGLLARIRSTPTLARYYESDSLYRDALSIARRSAVNRDVVADLLRGRALPLRKTNRVAEAREDQREALAIEREIRNGDHIAIARSLRELAACEENPQVADSLQQLRLAMEERIWGADHPNLFGPYTDLGISRMYQWRFSEAEPYLEAALGIVNDYYADDSEIAAQAANNLGSLYRRMGRFEEAEVLYRRALGIWMEQVGEEHEHAALGRFNLIGVLDRTGADSEAESLLAHSIALAEDGHGAESGWVALFSRAEATYANRRGQYERAERAARRALQNWGDGGGIFNRAAAASELGLALHRQRRLDEAVAAFAFSDSLYRPDGDMLPAGAENLFRIGQCRLARGDAIGARAALTEARALYVDTIGTDHPGLRDVDIALASLPPH